MKSMILAAAFVSTSLAVAEEIPVIDVSQSTVRVDPAPDSAPATPSPATQSTPPVVSPVPQKDAPQPVQEGDNSYPKRLRLFLRELSILQQAARSAGGDIQVTITPVGITAEDLVVPLTKSGWFNVRPDGDVIIVESRSDDPYRVELNADIAKLEKRRRVLLNQIETLERAAAESARTSLSEPSSSDSRRIPTGSEPRFTLSVIPQNGTTQPPVESPDMKTDSSVAGTPPLIDVTPKIDSSSDVAPRPTTVLPAVPVTRADPVPVPSTPDDPTKPRSIQDINRSINPPGVSSSAHFRTAITPTNSVIPPQPQPDTADTSHDPIPLVMNPRPRGAE